MFRRLFWLGLGAYAGAYAARRVERMRRSVSPAGFGDRVGRAAGEAAARLRRMGEEAWAAAAAREAELRSSDVPAGRDGLPS